MKAENAGFIQQYKFQLLYFVLFIHWVVFFQFGNIDYSAFDWYCIHQWTDVIKASITEGKIPYEAQLWDPASPGSSLFGKRYFALPFVILSPQIILLRWVSVSAFMIIQVLVTFSIGYYFLVKWCKKLLLSDLTSGFLIFSWVLNGALIGRMGVGHIQLAGYFMIPGFLYLLNQFLITPLPGKTIKGIIGFSIPMALYLFLVLIQGSIFVVYQMIIILVITSLFFFKRMKYIILTGVLFVLLASYFIYPNFLFGEYSNADAKLRVVFDGYSWSAMHQFIENNYQNHLPGFMNGIINKLWLLSGHPVLKYPIHMIMSFAYVLLALVVPFFPTQDASWEASAFIGPVGFILLLAGIYRYMLPVYRKESTFRLKEAIIVFIIFLMSFWNLSSFLFSTIQKFVPINAIDRLPTRFFMYPLFILLLVASTGLEKSNFLQKIQKNTFLRVLVIAGFLIPLVYNSYHWSASEVSKGSQILENTIRNNKPTFATKLLNSDNVAYIHTVNISIWVSFLSLLICCLVYFYFKNKMHKYENTF